MREIYFEEDINVTTIVVKYGLGSIHFIGYSSVSQYTSSRLDELQIHWCDCGKCVDSHFRFMKSNIILAITFNPSYGDSFNKGSFLHSRYNVLFKGVSLTEIRIKRHKLLCGKYDGVWYKNDKLLISSYN